MINKDKLIQQCMRGVSPKNWLVHRLFLEHLFSATKHYARGKLLDIGCATKPWSPILQPYVDEYIGVDHADSLHALKYVDIVADAYNTTVDDTSFDTVLCTAVLEHLERPQDAIDEMFRVLRSGGHVILTAPLFWHVHEAPRDFYRYTEFGLKHLFETAGFEVIEALPMSGFIVTFAQELVYFLNVFNRGLLKPIILSLQFLIQRSAYLLNRWDRSSRFTWAYMVVARKS